MGKRYTLMSKEMLKRRKRSYGDTIYK